MQPNNRYTYEQAGFNGFLNRSLKANPLATNVSHGMSTPGNTMNFDLQQVAGALGDILPIGKIKLDGQVGRIAIENKYGDEGLWLGDLVSQ